MSGLFSCEPGDVVAVGTAGNRTAAELLDDAGSVAAALDTHAAGEVLLVCSDRYLFAAGLVGAWLAGHAVLLPPNNQPATIRSIAAGSQVRAFLHDREGVPDGVHVGALLGGAHPRRGALPPPERHIVTVTTSGSTGAHQRCPKTASQLFGEAAVLAALFGIGRGARVLSSVPPHHIYGLLFGVLLPLHAGAAFVRESPLHLESVGGAVESLHATHLVSAPAHLAALCAAERLPPLQRAFSSGGPLLGATAQALRARHLWPVAEVFGSTETGGIAWREDADGPWQPFPGVTASAADDGRLLLESPFLSPASARPFACADRIAPLPDGRFHLLGRLDGVVKVAGKRVALREVEERLLALPGVQDAAAMASVSAGTRGTEIWAAVVAPGWTASGLRDALAAWLDPVTLPRRLRVVDVLPREATGKLVHERLRALLEEAERNGVLELDPDVERAMVGGAGEDVRELCVTVSPDLLYFCGHFEGRPVLPGVVQIDGLVLRQVRRLWPELDALRTITRLKFKQLITPGDRLTLRLTRESAGPRVSFEIASPSGTCASGTLLFRQDEART
ncbi:MAG: hypothetical protein A2V77_19040 [Anaeromyxobacter sp. RBG_16_69_14]|nr:MAG: hypothetical protein A2V77_19040 [Anaeromyxobacter sp. RBG_16_69_14]